MTDFQETEGRHESKHDPETQRRLDAAKRLAGIWADLPPDVQRILMAKETVNYCFAEILFPKIALTNSKISKLVQDLNFRGENNGIVCYDRADVAGGRFEDLESALIDQNIPFDRHTGGETDNFHESRYFRPMRGEEDAIDVSYTDTRTLRGPLLNAWEVKRALEEEGLEVFLSKLEDAFPDVTPLENWSTGEYKRKTTRYTVTLCSPYLSWEEVEAESVSEAIERCWIPDIDLNNGPYAWVVTKEEDEEAQ